MLQYITCYDIRLFRCTGFRGAEVMSILVCLQLFVYFIFIIAVIPELEGPSDRQTDTVSASNALAWS